MTREREREKWTRDRWVAAMFVVLAAATVAASVASASPSASPSPSSVQENVSYNGKFIFARLRYDLGMMGGFGRRGNGAPWAHDYPYAEHNLMQILSNVSGVEPGSESGNIIDIGDPELHKYPIAYMSEPGFWNMGDKEVENLRAYVLKGGFLIFDDFPGRNEREDAWPNFAEQMKRILPELQPQVLDATHPVFHSFFDIESLENLFGSYRGIPVFIGYFEDNDPSKRLVVIANYQNDLGENWEYEGRGFSVIPEASNEAFKFGINYILYGLTH